MKKIKILVSSVALSMIFSAGAFAAPEENTTVPTEEEDIIEVVDEEVTEEDIEEADETSLSDKFLYNFERLVDNLKVALTFDEEKKLELLKEIAEKRLLDSEMLLEEGKFNLSESALAEFEAKIDELNGLISGIEDEEVTEEEIVDEDVTEETTEEDVEENDEDVQENDEDVQENDDEEIDTVSVKEAVHNMVAKRHSLNDARKSYVHARVNLKKMQKHGSEETIALAEALLEEAKLAYDTAREELNTAFAEMKVVVASKEASEDMDEEIEDEDMEEDIDEDIDEEVEDEDMNEEIDEDMNEEERTEEEKLAAEKAREEAKEKKEEAKKKAEELREEAKKQREEEKKAAEKAREDAKKQKEEIKEKAEKAREEAKEKAEELREDAKKKAENNKNKNNN
ncbi:hypothetical protein GOQ27_00720 [Clostridium sp. D2Q-11]|uniref:DUF5667 domain-containing protein n=1 Tax=Anaeromonas frigoriresistens TaxID=2683708 RepID=A0A942Z523_9FIRM|nr:DUF5667 domain-containing protein [Anaeromonas frigoriresistens]MBS4536961.1 hypothetical protein [Anaeromonas frigoriresistens]